jgi:hypothetical protein
MLDDETRLFVQQSKHPALEFKDLTYIRSVDQSKALNANKEPMIIIAASGMAETGRILHHLKNNIENPRNTVRSPWQALTPVGGWPTGKSRFAFSESRTTFKRRLCRSAASQRTPARIS